MKKEIIYLTMTIAGGCLLLASTTFIIAGWSAIPDRIPVHFNFAGEPNGYGGRTSLIILLLVAWMVFVSMTVVAKLPSTWNIPVKVTAQNRARLYSITRTMLETLKFFITLLFIAMFMSITELIYIPPWIISALIAVVLLSVFVSTFRMFRNR